MKILAVMALISFSAQAQMPNMEMVKDMSKKVLEACKEDKSKIKGCESYTELAPLKTCLMANKEKLSDKCKSSLKQFK